MNILHKIKLRIARESLARMRRRVKAALKADSYALICRSMFTQGDEGYTNDKQTYKGGEG